MGSAGRPAGTGAAAEPAAGHVSLVTNGVTWYLRSSLRVDGESLEVITPRTVLGFIPIGVRRFDTATTELRRAALGSKLYPQRLPVAIGLALLLLIVDLAPFAGVLLGVATIAMLLLSFVAVIRFERSGERPFVVPICLAHIPRARRFIATVQPAATRSEAES